MALRALLLRKKLDEKTKLLEELRAKDARYKAREAELEAAISEAESEEDKAAVEGLVSEFESERKEHEDAKSKLDGEIKDLERDLKAEEDKQPPAGTPAPTNIPADPPAGRSADNNPNIERRETMNMNHIVRGFGRMDAQTRTAFLARGDVQDFLQRVRELSAQKRAVSGAELTIPEVVLELLRENVAEYSKLLSRVSLRNVHGKARQNIMGPVPEGIWTEATGILNELTMVFNAVEVDGYMVGGFIAIHNATLEDSDLNLASELMDALGKAIGYAVDKAIVYGTGKKMPLGVVPRLAQAAKPDNWAETAPVWKDLSAINIKKLPVKTGTDFFKQIVITAGAVKSKYSRAELTWVMNEKTKNKVLAEGLAFNAAGAIVSGVNGVMPVVGGTIITLDFVPDDDIILGYFDLYIMAERAGATVSQSEHVRFLQNQTVIKGVARYDGMPVFGEAFALINVNNAAPATSVPFAPDTANEAAPDTPDAPEG